MCHFSIVRANAGSYSDLSRNLNQEEAATFQREMLEAYPNNPALGCPYDGQNTTYGQPSQFKRMAAVLTDGTYTEAWTEYLQLFSTTTNTWGILFEEPLSGQGIGPAFGVQHGSDIPYYFPKLLGPATDPLNNDRSHLVKVLQRALINFVTDLDPNGKHRRSRYHWPQFRCHIVLDLMLFAGH